MIGRVLSAYGGPFQNARTDTPLVAWHEDTAGPGGPSRAGVLAGVEQ